MILYSETYLNYEIYLDPFIFSPEQLIDLFHMFHRDFPRVFESLATSTIKNEVVKYNLDEFRLHRARIEMMLHKALAKRLGGERRVFIFFIYPIITRSLEISVKYLADA